MMKHRPQGELIQEGQVRFPRPRGTPKGHHYCDNGEPKPRRITVVVPLGGTTPRDAQFASTVRVVIRYLAIIACILTFLFPSMSVSAYAAAGNGRIFGQLLNGTKNDMPVAGQSATLQMAQGDTAQDIANVTTDAHGNFSFANLSTDKTINYAVYTHYQGAQYVTDLITLDSKPTQQVNVTVYEATTSAAKLATLQATVLLHEPDVQKGTITVSEFFFFKNLDTHTYVGSLDASQGKPNALLFSLPRGARKVTLGKGFTGYKAIQIDRGFATDAALLPGNSQLAFSFEVPYNTPGVSTYDFSYVAMYPTVQLSVMVPPDVHASSGVLTSQGLVTADQHPYHLFKTSRLLKDEEVHLQLEGLHTSTPTSTPSPLLNASNIWLIVGLLLVLAVPFVIWFLLRPQSRQVATRKRGGQSSRGTIIRTTKGTKDTLSTAAERQQTLLQELLDLDKAFETGKLTKAVYQERRARIKARLRALMSEEEASRL